MIHGSPDQWPGSLLFTEIPDVLSHEYVTVGFFWCSDDLLYPAGYSDRYMDQSIWDLHSCEKCHDLFNVVPFSVRNLKQKHFHDLKP